ncbi:Protein canopy 4 [Orchesella cincta]|uniref:Protein canopy 4 n=1 Tax=Orchesella cincta TaxID=48709 RepID=A0A1D2NAC2_ORCCI|nr:Protein canopy 4 [Orchesella cincta]
MNPLDFPTTVTLIIALTSASSVLSENGDASKKAVKAKGEFEEENYGVKYASKCEVCKIVTSEVEHQLNSKFNSPEVLEIGYNYLQDSNKNKKKAVYEKSLIRLQEALESTCGAMLEYNIHKERKDWTRFARGQSQTFKTLHGLRNKGVKVDLGMPTEMWDKPSAEITQLKSQCDTFIETNEDEIESWYQDGSQSPLEQVICKKVLKKKEQGCLAESPVDKPVKTEL